MAFMEGFKKFMGMSPLDDGIDDDEQDEMDMIEEQPHGHNGFGYGVGMDVSKLDELDDVSSYHSGSDSYGSATGSMGAFSREESAKVVNIHPNSQAQVVLVKPERFEDATSIADHLMAKRTVIVNTDSVSQDVRRRLIDFLSGVAYSESGTIKQASNTTFVITPNTVGVMGESVVDEPEQDPSGGNYY